MDAHPYRTARDRTLDHSQQPTIPAGAALAQSDGQATWPQRRLLPSFRSPPLGGCGHRQAILAHLKGKPQLQWQQS